LLIVEKLIISVGREVVVTLNGTEYYINTERGSYRELAKSYCLNAGPQGRKRLVKFESAEKWELVTSWLNENGNVAKYYNE